MYATEIKLYVIVALISGLVWLSVPLEPLMFACIATAQSIMLWIVADAILDRVPTNFSLQWMFGQRRIVFAIVPQGGAA